MQLGTPSCVPATSWTWWRWCSNIGHEGSFLGLCFKLLLPNQNMWNILSHELGTECAISLIQVCMIIQVKCKSRYLILLYFDISKCKTKISQSLKLELFMDLFLAFCATFNYQKWYLLDPFVSPPALSIWTNSSWSRSRWDAQLNAKPLLSKARDTRSSSFAIRVPWSCHKSDKQKMPKIWNHRLVFQF